MDRGTSSLRSVLSVTCVSVTAATLLITITVTIVLSVSVTYSLTAADDFARSYSLTNVVAARNKVNDFVKIPIDAHAQIKAAVGYKRLPNVATSNFSDLALRRQEYDAWHGAFQPMLFNAQFVLAYVGVGMEDGTWLDCYVNIETNDANREAYEANLSASSLPYVPSFAHICSFCNTQNESFITETNISNNIYSEEVSYENYKETEVIIAPTDYDPRTRPWYIEAPKDAGARPAFSSVYVDFNLGMPVVDLNGPIHDPITGDFMGVTSLSLDLRQVSIFLTDTPRTENGFIALVDELGFLLGTSDERDVFTSTPIDTSVVDVNTLELADGCEINEDEVTGITSLGCRLRPTNFGNAVLRELYVDDPEFFISPKVMFRDHMNHNTHNNNNATSDPPAAFDLEEDFKSFVETKKKRIHSKDYMVSRATITARTEVISAAIDWLMVTLIPLSDVTGHIVQGRDVAVGIACAIVVVACGTCALVLYLLLSPLNRLAELMERVTQFKDDALNGGVINKSSMREIRSIQDAFEVLSNQLQRAKSFLPASLLAQLEAEDSTMNNASGPENDDDDDDEGDAGVSSEADAKRRAKRRGWGGEEYEDDDDRTTTNGDASTTIDDDSENNIYRSSQHSSVVLGGGKRKDYSGASDSAVGGAVFGYAYGGGGALKKTNGMMSKAAGGGVGDGSSVFQSSLSTHTTNTTTAKRSSGDAKNLFGRRKGGQKKSGGVVEISNAVSLTHRNVTIAALNLSRFHQKVQSKGPLSLEKTYGALVDLFQSAAKDYKGILDYFHGDHFYFTFNAVKPCGAHATMAVSAMLTIVDIMEENEEKEAGGSEGGPNNKMNNKIVSMHAADYSSSSPTHSSPPSPFPGGAGTKEKKKAAGSGIVAHHAEHDDSPLSEAKVKHAQQQPFTTVVTCGVATGRCLIGNLGSSSAKRFTVIGPAYSHAVKLEQLCKNYPNTPCLITNETMVESETSVASVLVDCIPLAFPTPSTASGGHQQQLPFTKNVLIASAQYLKTDMGAPLCGQQRGGSPSTSAVAVNVTNATTGQEVHMNVFLMSVAAGIGPAPPQASHVASAAKRTTRRRGRGIDAMASIGNNNNSSNKQSKPASGGNGGVGAGVDNEEWMYQLDNQENTCEFTNGNKAFRLALKGDYENARRCLSLFTDDSIEAKFLRHKIKSVIESGEKQNQTQLYQQHQSQSNSGLGSGSGGNKKQNINAMPGEAGINSNTNNMKVLSLGSNSNFNHGGGGVEGEENSTVPPRVGSKGAFSHHRSDEHNNQYQTASYVPSSEKNNNPDGKGAHVSFLASGSASSPSSVLVVGGSRNSDNPNVPPALHDDDEKSTTARPFHPEEGDEQQHGNAATSVTVVNNYD